MDENLAAVDAALLRGDVTADEPDALAMQSFALALRAAAPRPSEAFAELLDRRAGAYSALAAGAVPADRCETAEIRVLVAHGAPVVRRRVARALSNEPSLKVVGTALGSARTSRPDVIVLDSRFLELEFRLCMADRSWNDDRRGDEGVPGLLERLSGLWRPLRDRWSAALHGGRAR